MEARLQSGVTAEAALSMAALMVAGGTNVVYGPAGAAAAKEISRDGADPLPGGGGYILRRRRDLTRRLWGCTMKGRASLQAHATSNGRAKKISES